MKEILLNLALIDTLNYCKEHNIDCSGTHLIKNGRGYKYSLVKDTTDKPLVTVTFSKHSVPIHYIHINHENK